MKLCISILALKKKQEFQLQWLKRKGKIIKHDNNKENYSFITITNMKTINSNNKKNYLKPIIVEQNVAEWLDISSRIIRQTDSLCNEIGLYIKLYK